MTDNTHNLPPRACARADVLGGLNMPDGLAASDTLDVILHRLLIGFATHIPGRRAIMDGGRLVPTYTTCLASAALLFDARLPPEEWIIHRGTDMDNVWINAPDHQGMSIMAPRGMAAMALSLGVLARVKGVNDEHSWEDMAEELRALNLDLDARRSLQRL